MIRELSQTSTQIVKAISEVDNKTSEIGNSMQDFKIESELGRGSYGTVYKVLSNKDGGTYVLKKICLKHMKQKHQAAALKEVHILKTLHHPHVIKYHTSFMDDESMHIVMEYAEKGDLYRLLKEQRSKRKYFSEKDLWDFSYQICQAIEYLHAKNIMHRDIKCLNIFLSDDKKIKIGDLGVSKIVPSQLAMQGTRVGTPLYLSPELVKQQPYDFKVDIWAIGCALYHLASLEPPFQGDNLITLGNNIVNKKPKPMPQIYSNKFVNFVEKFLAKKPSERPTAKEAVMLIPTFVKQQNTTGATSYIKELMDDIKQSNPADQAKQQSQQAKEEQKNTGNSSNKTPLIGQDHEQQQRKQHSQKPSQVKFQLLHEIKQQQQQQPVNVVNKDNSKKETTPVSINFYGNQQLEKKSGTHQSNISGDKESSVIISEAYKKDMLPQGKQRRLMTNLGSNQPLQQISSPTLKPARDLITVSEKQTKDSRDLKKTNNDDNNTQTPQTANKNNIQEAINFSSKNQQYQQQQLVRMDSNPYVSKEVKSPQSRPKLTSINLGQQNSNAIYQQSTSDDSKVPHFGKAQQIQFKIENALNQIDQHRQNKDIIAGEYSIRELQQAQAYKEPLTPQTNQPVNQVQQHQNVKMSNANNIGSIELKRASLNTRPQTAVNKGGRGIQQAHSHQQQFQNMKPGISLLRNLSKNNELGEQAMRPFSAVVPQTRKLGMNQRKVVVFEDGLKENSITEIMNDDQDDDEDDDVDQRFNQCDQQHQKYNNVNILGAKGRSIKQQQDYQSQEPIVKKQLMRPQTANVMFRNNSSQSNAFRQSIEQFNSNNNNNIECLSNGFSIHQSQRNITSATVHGRQHPQPQIKFSQNSNKNELNIHSQSDFENQFGKFFKQQIVKKSLSSLQTCNNQQSRSNNIQLKEKITSYPQSSIYSTNQNAPTANSSSQNNNDSKHNIVGSLKHESISPRAQIINHNGRDGEGNNFDSQPKITNKLPSVASRHRAGTAGGSQRRVTIKDLMGVQDEKKTQ